MLFSFELGAFVFGLKMELSFRNQKTKDMFLEFLLRKMNASRQVQFLKKRGIVLGVRQRNKRQIYLYMYLNTFAEVLYKNDNPDEPVEKVVLISGLEKLNRYLERDVKSS